MAPPHMSPAWVTGSSETATAEATQAWTKLQAEIVSCMNLCLLWTAFMHSPWTPEATSTTVYNFYRLWAAFCCLSWSIVAQTRSKLPCSLQLHPIPSTLHSGSGPSPISPIAIIYSLSLQTSKHTHTWSQCSLTSVELCSGTPWLLGHYRHLSTLFSDQELALKSMWAGSTTFVTLFIDCKKVQLLEFGPRS